MKREYKAAEKPTLYFIGVTTAQSSIMKIFPEWSKYLRLGDCDIKGIDFIVHDMPQAYRNAVEFIKADPNSLGALVTTHKIDLLAACRDLFEELDPHALQTGEISCISKAGGRLIGHAKDPITSGLAAQAILPNGYWEKRKAEALIIGAGGSSVAISCYLMKSEHAKNRPKRIIITNRSKPRLDRAIEIHDRLNLSIHREYIHTPQLEDNDAVLATLPPYSLVINATGLGKDTPGSPITTQTAFPVYSIAWDFNYRGKLLFLEQARAQQVQQQLQIEDGWIYFIHGWLSVISEVFHVPIATKGKVLEDLSTIAEKYGRPPKE